MLFACSRTQNDEDNHDQATSGGTLHRLPKKARAIGGQRIVAAGAVRVNVIEDVARPLVEVTGLWWPRFAKARARRTLRSGRHPWFCRRCMGHRSLPPVSDSLPPCPGADLSHR